MVAGFHTSEGGGGEWDWAPLFFCKTDQDGIVFI